MPIDASSHGCRWPVAHKFKLPGDVASGYYQVLCHEPDKTSAITAAFFVVRPKEPGKNSKILLQLSTNTYNAYTNWGGYSLYSYNGRHKVQGRRVSFDRPLSSQFNNWEGPFVKWAESNGHALDYCVNSDLEFHPELLKHYKLVLSVGHDEYWSRPMRQLEVHRERRQRRVLQRQYLLLARRSRTTASWLACWKQSFGDDPFTRRATTNAHVALGHHLVARPRTRSRASGSSGAAIIAATGSSWPGSFDPFGPTTGFRGD